MADAPPEGGPPIEVDVVKLKSRSLPVSNPNGRRNTTRREALEVKLKKTEQKQQKQIEEEKEGLKMLQSIKEKKGARTERAHELEAPAAPKKLARGQSDDPPTKEPEPVTTTPFPSQPCWRSL